MRFNQQLSTGTIAIVVRTLLAAVLALGSVAALSSETAQASSAATASDSTTAAASSEKQPITFSGQLYAMMGDAVGWTGTPDVSDPRKGFEAQVGAAVTDYLYFDARPDPTFSFHGALKMAFPTYPAFTPSMYELYFDYRLGDAVSFRGGRQVVSWRSGRVFDVDDLMDDSGSMLSLKMYLPTVLKGFTLMAMVEDPGSSADLSDWKPNVEGAPRLDLAVGPFSLSEEATFLYGCPIRWDSTAKTSVLGIDLFGEVFGSWLEYRYCYISSLESAFWQTANRGFSLYAEHYFDGSDGYADDNRAAVIAAVKVPGFTLAAQWIHAFADGSGAVMPAILCTPFRHLSVTVGVPFCYGADGSIYADKAPTDFNSPAFNPDNLTNPNQSSPITDWDQRCSLFFKVEFTVDY